jgi:hypothetical protein
VGALLAGRTAVEALARELQARAPPRKEKDWRTLLTGVLGESRAALQEQAVARDVALRDLATTLILVAAGPGWIAAAQVGDGAAVAREAAGNARALTRPGSEEYLNQTVFLTAENALSQPQIVLWRGAARQVALFSDGLQMLALRMPGGEPHAPFFTPLFAFAESATDPEAARRELEGFLRSPRITGRTDDDLTLLLATLKR